VRGESNNAKEKCDKECDMEDRGNKLATTNENILAQGEVLPQSVHINSDMHVVESQNQEEMTKKEGAIVFFYPCHKVQLHSSL
jgi:hypothetical protein